LYSHDRGSGQIGPWHLKRTRHSQFCLGAAKAESHTRAYVYQPDKRSVRRQRRNPSFSGVCRMEEIIEERQRTADTSISNVLIKTEPLRGFCSSDNQSQEFTIDARKVKGTETELDIKANDGRYEICQCGICIMALLSGIFARADLLRPKIGPYLVSSGSDL